MSVDIVVIGAGGHGLEVASYVLSVAASGGAKLLGFIDDSAERSPLEGVPLLGNLERLFRLAGDRKTGLAYITAVGDNAARKKLVARIEAAGAVNLEPWSCRHPSATVGSDAVEIGSGTCLAPGAIVTAHARIGRHCILNIKASVSHDCRVGDFSNLNPGSTLCGNVTLGEGCYVGAGATIIERVRVGPWTIIGAGAVVVRDLPGGVTAVGVPASVVK